MTLSPDVVTKLVGGRMLPIWQSERRFLDTIDEWYRGKQDEPWRPRKTSQEYKELQRRSLTPWLSLPVTAVAQALVVEGYRAAKATDNARPWRVWQANAMDARQAALYRGALAHGCSYVSVVRGVLHGEPMAKVRGHSARSMVTVYEDPIEDEWPQYALAVDKLGKDQLRLKLYDDVAVYPLIADESGGGIKLAGPPEEHGAAVCPIVRFTNLLDLDGRSIGEVEPYIPIAARIDQTTFDRLMVQKYASWKVRYATGLAKPETPQEAEAARLKLAADDLLLADSPDVKFGTLDESRLDGFIEARDADIRDLSAVSQTPPHYLLGQMANLSADALAAAEASLMRKVQERKHSFGESHEQWLRLAAHIMGDQESARDFEAQVWWRDLESRSLAQAADALGKLATMLNIPVEVLWEKVPGLTHQDIERAKKLLQQGDSIDMLLRELERQAENEPAPPEDTELTGATV